MRAYSTTGSGARGKRLHQSPSGNSGQAIVEFLVAAIFVLVPLFLAISAIGKFADVQHTADAAARYATWERTIWYEGTATPFQTKNGTNTKSATEISNELAARILNDRSSVATVIKSTDKSASGFINGLNPMWRDPAGNVYLTDYAQLNSAAANIAANETAAAIAAATYALEKLDVPSNTLATASVTFKTTAASSGTYQRLWSTPTWAGLDFTAKGAILSNTWAANGSAGALEMVSGLVATRNTRPGQLMGTTLTGMGASLAAWDPGAMSGLHVGRIAIDEVPPDRLK
jgi:hypothetical protein